MQWRTADVTLVFKKGEKYEPTNYQPMSLTSITCKLFEHISSRQMMTPIEENGLLILRDTNNEFHIRASERSCRGATVWCQHNGLLRGIPLYPSPLLPSQGRLLWHQRWGPFLVELLPQAQDTASAGIWRSLRAVWCIRSVWGPLENRVRPCLVPTFHQWPPQYYQQPLYTVCWWPCSIPWD